jgi:hypothetical protein
MNIARYGGRRPPTHFPAPPPPRKYRLFCRPPPSPPPPTNFGAPRLEKRKRITFINYFFAKKVLKFKIFKFQEQKNISSLKLKMKILKRAITISGLAKKFCLRRITF